MPRAPISPPRRTPRRRGKKRRGSLPRRAGCSGCACRPRRPGHPHGAHGRAPPPAACAAVHPKLSVAAIHQKSPPSFSLAAFYETARPSVPLFCRRREATHCTPHQPQAAPAPGPMAPFLPPPCASSLFGRKMLTICTQLLVNPVLYSIIGTVYCCKNKKYRVRQWKERKE